MKRINKRSFHEQFSNINDPNVIETSGQLKNVWKVVFTAPRMVYTESVRKLHSSFCQKFIQASLTVFFKHKPHYCIKPTKKEKLSCLCINCLNHTSSSNRLTSSANLMVYHHMIPWRSTSNILIREKVLSKLMMIRQASFIHIKGS